MSESNEMSWVAFFILTHLVAAGVGITFADMLRERREKENQKEMRR